MRPNTAGKYEWERRGAPLDDLAMEQHVRALAVSLNPDGEAAIRFPERSALRALYASVHSLTGETDSLPAGMEWLAENGRMAEALMRSLCPDHSEALPALEGTARIERIMQALVRHGDGRVTLKRLTRCLIAFGEVRPLAMRELWAAPSALASALTREYMTAAADVLDAQRDRIAAERWACGGAEINETLEGRSAAFFERALSVLRERDVPMKYQELTHWLSQKDRPAEREVSLEHERQAFDRLLMGNILTTMRMLDALDWSGEFEKISRTEQALRSDPAGTYPAMDDESRARVRARVTALANAMDMGEETVARYALEAADQGEGICREITWWLYTDAGGEALGKRMGTQGRIPRMTPDPKGKKYMTAVIGLAALLFGAAFWLWGSAALFGIPVWWGAAAGIVNRISLALVKPHPLMKLNMESVPDDMRTLVVMPALLSSCGRARELAGQLETLGCLEKDENISFLLLGDLMDHDGAVRRDDDEIVQAAEQAIAGANRRAGREKYIFLHRARMYQACEDRFMGRERKRGALNALNRLLTTGENAFCQDEAKELAGRFRFVLTLDAGTRMLPGTVRKMIGAMAHPVNRRHTEPDGSRGGYALLAPRMETPADAVVNRFIRLMAGPGGVDSYPTAVSDVYQDLCGQGVFGGKGIYDVAAFEEALSGKLPDNAILSHDMIEGIVAGAGFLNDIALYDGFPRTVKSYAMRQHRWIRGDWQLGRLLNRKTGLGGLDIYRILDNMRRSLEAPAQMALLYAGFYMHSWPMVLAGLLPVWLPMILHPRWTKDRWAAVGLKIVMLPQEAFTALSAVITALWRMTVTHKHLLQWVTADDAERRGGNLSPAPGWAASVLLLPAMVAPTAWLLADVLLAAVWWTGAALMREMERKEEPDEPDGEDKELMMELARRTFRFFEENTTDTGLPPDNVQMDPPVGAAMRTSPTNIGMYLAACVSARELGVITGEELARRASQTLVSLEKMEKWNGQVYNWYHPETLQPLRPRYVSSVDSGNLAACLLLCARELEAEGSGDLAGRMEALVRRMDFTKLFDAKRKLFYIGMDVENERMSAAHYDLLASESRILSFTAMMLGQVPVSHWAHLGRAAAPVGGSAALISWSGTMFEYLMPDLLLPAYENTLPGQTQRAVIRAQQKAQFRAGGENMPWGISESGYYAFDPAMNYQYRAFGLPELSLRGGAGEKVIAPYASMLAMPHDPEAAAENLRHMISLGLMDEQGLFEAIDCSEKRIPDGESMRIVRSHMAHHQGMILCALCNALTDNVLVRRFMGRTEAQALSLLLQEKPAVKVKLSARKSEEERTLRRQIPAPEGRRGRIDQNAPDTHLLSGCGTTMVLCADGSGFVRRGGVLLNRRETDAAMPGQGLFVHVHDVGEGRRICVSGMRKEDDVRYEMRFDAGSALTTAQTGRFTSELRTLISPEDGACLQQITLTNRTDLPMEMDVTACFQVALAREADYTAHPAFQNLFVESSLAGPGVLCFRRRPRSADEENLLLIHAAAGADAGCVSWETDLHRLIGREGDIGEAGTMNGPLQGTLGHVLMPCSALRIRISLPAQGKKHLCFAAGLVREEEKNAFIERHTSMQAAGRALELAASQAKEMIRYLGLNGSAWQNLDRGAALMLFPSLKKDMEREIPWEDRTVRQLWEMGISGDLPVMLGFAERADRLDTVKELIRAHEFYRLTGVECDLVLVHEHGGDYAQPMRDRLYRLIAGSHLDGSIGQTGGVHILSGKTMTEEQREALRAAAGIIAEADEASLGAVIRKALAVVPEQGTEEKTEEAGPVSAPELLLDNGWGGFTREGYAIYRTPAPAPWCNILCNRRLGSMVSERGGGFIWYKNSRNGRLTPFDNDPLREGWGDMMLLKANGKTWAPSVKAGLITHKPGASIFEGRAETLDWKLTQFVDREMPVKCHLVEVRAKEDIRLDVQARIDWLMQVSRSDRKFTRTGFADGAWWARGSVGATGFACLPGLNAHMGSGGLTGRIDMKKGEVRRIECLIGAAEDAEQMRSIRVHWHEGGGGERRLQETLAYWEERLGRMSVQTPDELLNRTVNEFLPYQTLCGRIWGRAGFYQAGGAFGFRDQLQDMLAMLPTDPEMVKKHLILCAGHQFQSGDVMHWWHPEYEGVRTRISDDMLFLPYVTAEYAAVTQDKDILGAMIPFLKDVEIPEGQEDWYGTAEVSGECGTLHEHCVRAVRRGLRVGRHGLILMGTGDWNDGMNRVGHGGVGESVWLTEFMIVVLEKYAPLCDTETKEEFQRLAGTLREAVEQYGWDGKWYRRAYMDDGYVLGSAETKGGCMIDSISQSWAALAGLSRERVKTALNEARRQLIDREHGIIRLLTPPFDGEGVDPGYIRGYPPGVRENGGQYTHAACWLVIALAEAGMAEEAWEAFYMLMPWRHADTKEKAEGYRVEPYVVAADIYGEGAYAGRGGWTWYTGAAGWMLRAAYVHLLGYRQRGDYVSIRAILPERWDEVSVKIRKGAAVYTLTARRSCGSPMIDGAPMPPEGVKLIDDGREHTAVFPPAKGNEG